MLRTRLESGSKLPHSKAPCGREQFCDRAKDLPPVKRLLVYFEFARVAFLKILAYRLRYYTGIVTYFVNVSVYYFIWQAIYSSSPSVAGYDLRQMLTYVAVGWIIRSFYFNNVDREMAAEVAEGKIAMSLIKPVDTQLMYLAQTVGEACFRAVLFTLPIAALLVFVYPIEAPASFSAGLLFLVSCVFSLLIFTMINFIVGMMALHIYSILGVIRAKYFIVEFMSGLLVPITFFPEKLQSIMFLLPFPHVSFTPLQIYLGKVKGGEALGSIAMQAAWVAVLFLAGRFGWRLSTRRLCVQGG
jgi:ABC-2 type transport system permease protein